MNHVLHNNRTYQLHKKQTSNQLGKIGAILCILAYYHTIQIRPGTIFFKITFKNVISGSPYTL